ncbi:unnamed protein product [Diabrotica balteata]|uniref:Uncharacterized protein n=1 Tax=Diabrotica balteata TaxID=107213 RepID=A0A9N9TBS7_DIABA|nr:unnamed protein product [Diabrotica balteata]
MGTRGKFILDRLQKILKSQHSVVNEKLAYYAEQSQINPRDADVSSPIVPELLDTLHKNDQNRSSISHSRNSSSSSSSSSYSYCNSSSSEAKNNDQSILPTTTNSENEIVAEHISRKSFPRNDSALDRSFYEDSDDSVKDPNYEPDDVLPKDANLSQSTSSSTCLTSILSPLASPVKKGRKRERKEENWKKNVLQKLKISGKEYQSHTSHKKVVKAKKIKPPCKEKCKLQCRLKLTQEEREAIFNSYWALDSNENQWNSISKSMESICPKYRYIREGGSRPRRHNNNSFYFHLPDKKVRVCKTFFKAILDITDRPIRTVTEKQNKVANTLLEKDQRGKHGKHQKIDEKVQWNPPAAIIITLDFFLNSLHIYSLLCVISQYQELKAGRGRALDDQIYRVIRSPSIIPDILSPNMSSARRGSRKSVKFPDSNPTQHNGSQLLDPWSIEVRSPMMVPRGIDTAPLLDSGATPVTQSSV